MTGAGWRFFLVGGLFYLPYIILALASMVFFVGGLMIVTYGDNNEGVAVCFAGLIGVIVTYMEARRLGKKLKEESRKIE